MLTINLKIRSFARTMAIVHLTETAQKKDLS